MFRGQDSADIIKYVAAIPLTLWVAGCATTSQTKTRSVVEPWTQESFSGKRITTEHFDVFSTVRDDEFELGLPAFVEAVYRRYEATLPSPAGKGDRLSVYIFGTRFEWSSFTQRRFPHRGALYSKIGAGGFTEKGVSVLFYVDRGATLATLAHEGWHQYVESRFDVRIPAWLNEGLACYHEAVECAGVEPVFTPQRNTFRIAAVREALQRDTLMTLSELVNTNAGEVISQDHSGITRVYYTQAWSLVTFLRHRRAGRYAAQFNRLLQDVSDGSYAVRLSAARLASAGKPQTSLNEVVFETYFGCAPEELADEYYDYIVRLVGY